MTSQPSEKSPLTLAEFLQQPETKPPWEYIRGKPHQKPMPTGKHSRLQAALTAQINQQSSECLALGQLRCTFGDRSLIPSLSIFTKQRIPLDDQGEIADNFNIPPDWIIEILLPQQSTIRVMENILFCLDHGTTLGWIVDPQERLILSFGPHHSPQTHEGQARPPLLPQLAPWQPTAHQIFACLTLT